MLCVSPSTLALSPRVPQGNLRLSCIPPQPGRTLTPLSLGVPRPVGAGSPVLASLAAGTPAGTGRVPSCGESSWPGAGVQVAQRPRTGPFITREHGLLERWCPEGAEALQAPQVGLHAWHQAEAPDVSSPGFRCREWLLLGLRKMESHRLPARPPPPQALILSTEKMVSEALGFPSWSPDILRALPACPDPSQWQTGAARSLSELWLVAPGQQEGQWLCRRQAARQPRKVTQGTSRPFPGQPTGPRSGLGARAA